MERVEVKIALRADVVRSDLSRGLVWFVNYAAIDPAAVKAADLDLHGTAMMPADVEMFAHRWMAYSRSIDIEHDGIGRPIHVVESFFNSPQIASPTWPKNAHAVRLDIAGSKEAMDGMKAGRLNSVSLDAYTFNKIERLPVAASRGAPVDGWLPPADAAGWALELAQDGFDGVTAVHKVSSDLYLAERSSGLPIGIAVYEDGFEASSSDLVWGRLAASVMGSPSLVSEEAMGAVAAAAKHPIAPEDAPWSFTAADGNEVLGDPPDWNRYRSVHAWEDPGQDRESKARYKLPIAKVTDGSVKLYWKGTVAAMSALMGGRGGVNIPDADRQGVYRVLSAAYRRFDREPPPFTAQKAVVSDGAKLIGELHA